MLHPLLLRANAQLEEVVALIVASCPDIESKGR